MNYPEGSTNPDVHPLDQFPDHKSIKLSDLEIRECKNVAQKIAEMWGTNNNSTFSKNMEENRQHNLTGIMGEYAVRKYYNIPEKLIKEDEGDGGFDIEMNGEKVDVKTRDRRNADMLIDPGRYEADVFILVERRHQNFGLIGGIRKHRVKHYDKRGDKFPFNPYFIPRGDLSGLPEP